MQEAELESLIKKVLEKMDINTEGSKSNNSNSSSNINNSSLDNLEDLGDMDFRKEMRVPNPQNLETYMK